MVAQQHGLHEQSIDDHQFQDPYAEEEEEEDTLSFCDLPLTSTSCSSFSFKDDQNSSFGDEGFFEFFSEDDFTASTNNPAAADQIIFCGKVIGSSKEEENEDKTRTVGRDRKAQNQEFNNDKIKGSSSHKVRTTSSRRHQVKRSSSSRSSHRTLSSQGSLKEVFIMSAPPLMKLKWYVFEFGMGRYSMEMEQRDIKMRQSRRVPSTMFQMVEKDEEEGNGRRSGKGLWGLLKLLGCKKNQKNRVR